MAGDDIVPFEPFVHFRDGQWWINSREIVRIDPSKQHNNVLRAIDNHAALDPEFNQLNFELVEYLDAKGERRRSVDMTEDGFRLVGMSFTGETWARLRIATIKSFRDARDRLENLNLPVAQYGKILEELRQGQLKLEEKVSRVDGNVYHLRELVERRVVPGIEGRRADIKESTKLDSLRAVWRQTRGMCPSCRKVCITDEKCEKIGRVEFDHHNGRHRNSIYDIWPLCGACHDKKTKGEVDAVKVKLRFDLFQEAAKSFFDSLNESKPRRRRGTKWKPHPNQYSFL